MAKSRFFIVAFFALFLGAQSAWGAEAVDEREYRFMQGVINARTSTSVLLNESVRVNMTRDTKFFDAKARKSTPQAIANHKWLYVEGVKERDGSITAAEVYYLPGYISKKDRPKYGFMQLP